MDSLEVKMLQAMAVSKDGIASQRVVKGEVIELPLETANALIRDTKAIVNVVEPPKPAAPIQPPSSVKDDKAGQSSSASGSVHK